MMFRREGRSVAIDFRLTARQRELQLQSRKFAREVLSPALEAEALPTPEERFAATKPAYEATIAAGFLRKCIPSSAGGENAGLTDTAIMVEELYAVNASVTLTLIGTVLGLLPLLIGGTEEQRSRLLPPFLKQTGAPLAGFCATEPGGSANAASPPPGEAFVPRLRFGVTDGLSKVEKVGFPRPQVGIARARTFYRYFAD
jgi:nitroalkane oxidase